MPDIIDTRDLNKRLEELEDELEVLREAVSDAEEEISECDPDFQEDVDAAHEAHSEALTTLKDWEDENLEELEELRILSDEIPGWRHGEALINDDYFSSATPLTLPTISTDDKAIPGLSTISTGTPQRTL